MQNTVDRSENIKECEQLQKGWNLKKAWDDTDNSDAEVQDEINVQYRIQLMHSKLTNFDTFAYHLKVLLRFYFRKTLIDTC